MTPAWRVGKTTASSSPHRLQFRVKKEGWGGGGTRSVTFSRGSGDVAVLKASGKALTVSVGDGLPKSSSESAQNQEIGAQEAGPVGGGIRDRDQSKPWGGASEGGQKWVMDEATKRAGLER